MCVREYMCSMYEECFDVQIIMYIRTHVQVCMFTCVDGVLKKFFSRLCSGDPLSNKTITFDSQEEAVAFALKNGLYSLFYGFWVPGGWGREWGHVRVVSHVHLEFIQRRVVL